MKHIKLFENKNDELWLVIYISNMSPDDHTINIFDDEKSAENFFIDFTNDIARENKYQNGNISREQADETDYIFTTSEAEEYIEENGLTLYYTKYYNKGTYDLPQSLKLGGDAKKYNL